MNIKTDTKSIVITVVLTLMVGWVVVEVFKSATAGMGSANEMRNTADEMRRIRERNSQ